MMRSTINLCWVGFFLSVGRGGRSGEGVGAAPPTSIATECPLQFVIHIKRVKFSCSFKCIFCRTEYTKEIRNTGEQGIRYLVT